MKSYVCCSFSRRGKSSYRVKFPPSIFARVNPASKKLTHGLKVRSLFVLDDRGIDGDFAAVGILSDGIENLLQGRGLDGKTVLRAIGDADPGVEKPQIIIYLRHGSDRGTRIVRRRLLID